MCLFGGHKLNAHSQLKCHQSYAGRLVWLSGHLQITLRAALATPAIRPNKPLAARAEGWSLRTLEAAFGGGHRLPAGCSLCTIADV